MSTHSIAGQRPRASAGGPGAFFMVATLLLGLLVGVLALVSVLMWADAHDARKGSTKTTMNHQMAGMPGMPGMQAGDMPAAAGSAGALTSYAGAAPANADALATAHKPFAASLPPAPAEPAANVNLVLKGVTIQIAPGVSMRPGPGPEAHPVR